VPTIHHLARCLMVGTLRFAHPTTALPLRLAGKRTQVTCPPINVTSYVGSATLRKRQAVEAICGEALR
jgi:hypothetical protein